MVEIISTINGKIELSASNSDAKDGMSLTLKGAPSTARS